MPSLTPPRTAGPGRSAGGSAPPGSPGPLPLWRGYSSWPGPGPGWRRQRRSRHHLFTGHHGRRSGPLRRSGEDRLFGGVASGLSRRVGVDVAIVRIAFVILALAGGFGIAAYVAVWLLVPMEGEDASIAARASQDRRGIVLSLAFLPALVLGILLAAAFHVAVVATFAWPFFVGAAGLVLVWRNCGPAEQAWLRDAAAPVLDLGPRSARHRQVMVARFGGGAVLVAAGLIVLISRHPTFAALRPLGGALCVIAGFVVLFGPWWLRIARDLVAEREARARAEDRADMAARVHDSVLQTLAMIQRSADQPQKVVQLARAQERELRAWLFDGELPGTSADAAATLAAALRLVAQEVESAHDLAVDVVTVGDCPLDDRMRAILGAVREALVNAAKWSGVTAAWLYAEVEPRRVSVFVRDRGRGFDLDGVDEDRRGITESIQSRVLRQGGRATVRTAPGQGTEVELSVPLQRDRR